ncbi:MAG TPA: helix-turn-helix domain-containing protein [Clostridia bacterium]|nr:helix-turn-helix domain-containing protein [Clostridia bacterium]
MHYSKPTQDTINYINENLTTNLSLEALAQHMHFSPYHLHRLFLLCTGETPMEYVRRQRLRAASQDLLIIKISLIEIALKYRFESQDGFCRAFKRYYGITPGEYRKLNILIRQSDNPKKIEEEHTIMYDTNIYEWLACSHSDKKEALSTLDKILELSEKSKCSGILSLEPEIDTVQPEIFKKSLEMLIDGIEPQSLREILLNYTLCGGYKGKELLIRMLIIEGILAIQQGSNTLILREKLSSFFGEDFISEIQKHFGIDSESQLKKIDTFIAKYLGKSFLSKETSLLEDPLAHMDSRSLQRLLREIDTVTLTMALCGASGKTQAKILKNVSRKIAVELIDKIGTLDTPIALEIIDSQKRVLETLNELRNQGDIII